MMSVCSEFLAVLVCISVPC